MNFVLFTVKAREVELENFSSRLNPTVENVAGSSTSESHKSLNSGKEKKRGRPKSERKELDKELFKRLKNNHESVVGGLENQDSQDTRQDFQKEKLEKFKNGMCIHRIFVFLCFNFQGINLLSRNEMFYC